MSNRNKERRLRACAILIFAVYIVMLLRITLFKQVSLYNLFAAIGASERTISIIPFKSVFEMVHDGVSAARVIENVLGNLAVFMPLGLLLPILTKDKSKKILLYGFVLSLFIEVMQYILALGSSDIDDLLLNTLGAMVGYAIYKAVRRKSRTDTTAVAFVLVITMGLGSVAGGIFFVSHTELFMLSPKDTVVENGELVQSFIDTPRFLSGKFVEVNGNTLTVEKSVDSAAEARLLVHLEITPNSAFYICHDKTDYPFNAISGEQIFYEKIEYADFVSQAGGTFTKENNVQIWSADGTTVEHLIIIEWNE